MRVTTVDSTLIRRPFDWLSKVTKARVTSLASETLAALTLTKKHVYLGLSEAARK